MKKNLGKILLLLLLATLLQANSLAEYSLWANKTQAYTKEAIMLTFKVTQKDTTDNMFFLLTPKANPDYEIQLLKKESHENAKHHREDSFTYLVFPLVAKEITVDFDFSIQTASDKAVAQSCIDDHDGGKAILSNIKKIPITPLKLTIMQPPIAVDLVGDYTLKAVCEKTEATEYEDVNIIYTLEGQGYLPAKNALLDNLPNVTLFSEVHDVYKQLTNNGMKSKRVYTYALSAKEDFLVPTLQLKAYSYTKHKVYTLTTPSYAIHIKRVDPLSLLDKKESPLHSEYFTLEQIKSFFIAAFIFMVGFTTAKLSEIDLKKGKKEKQFEDIQTAKSAQALVMLLLSKYRSYPLEECINELEKLQYSHSSKNLQGIKKEILQSIR